MLAQLQSELQKLSNPQRAKSLQRFFKTGKGEYGEGDQFVGLTLPQIREVTKKYAGLKLPEIRELLHSKIHEHRALALIILKNKYRKADTKNKAIIYKCYLQNSRHINNWDLVDMSAPNIVGDFLINKSRQILDQLAKSNLLWDRRIAVLATFTFIKNNDFADSLRIAQILLNDKEDLMHKAVGWMLREIGKKDQKVLEKFLKQQAPNMPRTMLRYALEKLPEEKRQFYLKARKAQAIG